MGESILNNKRILAVDDEPDILETLEDLLEGYNGLESPCRGDGAKRGQS